MPSSFETRIRISGFLPASREPVRITLVHNPTAGSGVSQNVLVGLLEDAGHEVRAVSTRKNWRKALGKPADLVVAAGGDGTIHDVALALAEAGLPLAVLPLGTANNVGNALEILGDARPVIAAWEDGSPRPLDLGTVTAPWGKAAFVESMGGGAFAALVGSGQEIEAPSVLLGRETDRALSQLSELLTNEPVRPWSVSVDDESHDGNYVAVEMLNIRFVGPNVPLAADADPGDGLLDVVLIGTDEREALQRYLAERLRLAGAAIPMLRVVRGREVQLIAPSGAKLHLDDEPWPNAEPLTSPAEITVALQPGALTVL
jgi:diacylglycerol kinase family enzyme